MTRSMGFRCFLRTARSWCSPRIATRKRRAKRTCSLRIGWSEGSSRLVAVSDRSLSFTPWLQSDDRNGHCDPKGNKIDSVRYAKGVSQFQPRVTPCGKHNLLSYPEGVVQESVDRFD